MKCPKCVEQGLRSTVRSYGTMSTLMSGYNYYDEDGLKHNHDPNRRTEQLECSNGHSFSRTYWYGCSVDNCDFNANKKEEIKFD